MYGFLFQTLKDYYTAGWIKVSFYNYLKKNWRNIFLKQIKSFS